MNVNAAPTPHIATRLPVYEPSPLPSGETEEDDVEQPQAPTPTASLSAIEKQFASLVKELSQQLKSLENQLAQALKQLSVSQKPGEDKPEASELPPPGHPRFHRYGKIINDSARRHEVDPLLVGAVIRHESGFQPAVVSKTGAMGLMQLMPDTAKSLGVNNAFDPQQNIEGGTTLLRRLLDRYHGQLDLALAAYNAGPGAVDKYGGIPPYPETQAYVRNVMETYREEALSA